MSLRTEIIAIHNDVLELNKAQPTENFGESVRRQTGAIWDALELIARRVDPTISEGESTELNARSGTGRRNQQPAEG